MAGKGDKYRPVDPNKWEEGWERIFGNKKCKDKKNESEIHDRRRTKRSARTKTK